MLGCNPALTGQRYRNPDAALVLWLHYLVFSCIDNLVFTPRCAIFVLLFGGDARVVMCRVALAYSRFQPKRWVACLAPMAEESAADRSHHCWYAYTGQLTGAATLRCRCPGSDCLMCLGCTGSAKRPRLGAASSALPALGAPWRLARKDFLRNRQAPTNCAGRFSRKALTPSLKSLVCAHARKPCASRFRCPSRSF